MDLLRKEIERKRKEIEETKLLTNQKKFFKRGDLEQKLTDDFNKKRSEDDAEKQRKDESDQEKDYQSKSERAKNALKKDEGSEKKIIPRNEVIKRLRNRNQPIRFFGESDLDGMKRLKMIESTETQTDGMRNDFKAAMDQTEQESVNEIMNSVKTEETNTEADVLNEEIDFNEILDLSKKQREKNTDSLLVLKYIKMVCKKWGQELNHRVRDLKLSIKGRIETALHAQTVSHLKPLCRKLKTKTLPDDILDSLTQICLELIDRNYIKANQHFLEMAIGNAPWPIGATMVGIHARPGRERISSKRVAHVLNDETQRKYIQGIKRLISKCQQYFVTDPSRCVEYSLVATELLSITQD